MLRFSRGVLFLAVLVAASGAFACTALSGADGLGSPTDDIPLRERRYNDGSASSEDDAGGPARSENGRGRDPSAESPGSDSGGVPASESDAGFDANTTTPAGFIDAFGRADSPVIGNGWTEKQDRFGLSAGTVTQTGTGSYIDWIVRRPTTENGLDVQLEVDFTYGTDPDCDPTLYARMQPNSDQLRTLSGYTFFAYPDFAGLDREDGSAAKDLAGTQISPPLQPGQTYHYVFRVTGTNPVKIEAMITSGTTTIATLSTTDGDPKRVSAAGQIGFGSGFANGGRWDNFKRTDL